MRDRRPDRMPERMSEYLPDRIPVRLPDRMAEYMSDRLSDFFEYISEYTFWHVMVGITRSKVILPSSVTRKDIQLHNQRKVSFLPDMFHYDRQAGHEVAHMLAYSCALLHDQGVVLRCCSVATCPWDVQCVGAKRFLAIFTKFLWLCVWRHLPWLIRLWQKPRGWLGIATERINNCLANKSDLTASQ